MDVELFCADSESFQTGNEIYCRSDKTEQIRSENAHICYTSSKMSRYVWDLQITKTSLLHRCYTFLCTAPEKLNPNIGL